MSTRPQPFLWGPKNVRDRDKAILDFIESVNPVDGIGISFSDGPKGRVPFLDPASGTSGATASHPFQVLTRPKPHSSSITQAGVIYQSSLYLSLKPNDKYSITGLLSEDQSEGWFDLIGADAIWLGVTFDGSGSPDWAGIDSWGQSDDFDITKAAWSRENGYCEDDAGTPAKHQTSRKLIAYTVANEDGEPILTQVMRRDQLLRDVCIDGRPARYPFDHEGGYSV